MHVHISSPKAQHRLVDSLLSVRRRLRLVFYLFASSYLLLIITCTRWLREEQYFLQNVQSIPWAPEPGSFPFQSPFRHHPIASLITVSNNAQKKRLAERSLNLKTAARQYRVRRGRHPPPGFDEWYKYAERNDAIIVESFFDRIYKDVAPLWGIDPAVLVEQAAGQGEATITYRNGGVLEKDGGYDCATNLKKLMDEVAKYIPDLDMPIDCYDESRLFVPWENISELAAVEEEKRAIVPKEEVIKSYTGLANFDTGNVTAYNPPLILDGNNWDIVEKTCPPDSAVRTAVHETTNFSTPAVLGESGSAAYSYHGFVKNATTSMDFCTQPHLVGMHGSLFQPATLRVSEQMYPLFGGGKLLRANELLIPDAAYLDQDDSMYVGGPEHGSWWEAKRNGITWRGSPTGPSFPTQNWRRMQRTRLVEILNGTTIAAIESHQADAETFTLPSTSMYSFPRRQKGTVGKWLQEFADVGFVGDTWDGPILEYFNIVEMKTMASQYEYKFIPDIDGNGFSGRYRALVLSSSVPLKATLHTEWHDDRLLPWLHYVPVDNTFQDIHAILDYFTSDKHGDDNARKIAEEGQKWGNRVLRRQDMLLYVWRLLLEFARVCDHNREKLGYIGDLD